MCAGEAGGRGERRMVICQEHERLACQSERVREVVCDVALNRATEVK